MTLLPCLIDWRQAARRFAACAVTGIAVMMLSAEAAPADPISVRPAQPPPSTFEYTSASDVVRYAFTIENSGADRQSVQIVVSPVRQVGGVLCEPGTAACTLAWQVKGQAVRPDQAFDLALEAKSSAELVLQGVAKPAGTFRAEVSVRPATQGSGFTPVSAVVVVKRSLVNLGDKAMVFGPGGTRTPDWPLQVPKPLALTIVNGSDLPVQLAAAPDVQFLGDDSSNTYSVDAGRQTAGCLTQPPYALLPGAALACDVPLSSLSKVGRYRAEVEFAQPGIASIKVTRDFTVRLACLWAFATILVGALFGAAFAGWQNSGRRRAVQSAEALTLKSSFAAIARDLRNAPPATKSPKLVQGVIYRLDQIATALANTSTADFATEIAALRARLPSIHRFAALEAAYFQAGLPAAALAAYNDAAAAIEKSEPTADLDAKLDALMGKLHAAAAAVAATGARVGAPPQIAGADATLSNQFFFKWSTRSPDRLLRMVRNIDTIVLLVTILLVALIGVVTLWQPNATWGSLGDILTALFTGFAATAAGTLGLRELTSSYTLGKIAGTR